MELTQFGLIPAAQAMRRGEFSPVELTQAYLDRIEKMDPGLNTFITLTAEPAIESARRAETELRQGKDCGLLHGIPLALKDLYETRGVRTTAGSTFFRDYVPEEDAAAVQQLKAAGAVLLGKLNMHEIALGVTNVNPHFGPCRNPWNRERVSGGSSGGSAAALAAQLCLGSLGSDTGGSIRIPSSLCGVVGLKPTYGRVSLRGVMPLSWNLDHAGPMARGVADAAVLLQAIASYDPQDPASVNAPVEDYLDGIDDGVKGWKVAVAAGEFFTTVDDEVWAAIENAGEVFTRLGAMVEFVDFPEARRAAQANGLMVVADAAAVHRERLEQQPEGFGADVLQRLRSGADASSTEYVLARRTQVELRHKFEQFFGEYDLLLTPATPIPAPPIEGPDAVEQARRLTRFTAPFNLTGLPAISIPCGFTRDGLPIGLQVVAGPWQEKRLLRGARAFEAAVQ